MLHDKHEANGYSDDGDDEIDHRGSDNDSGDGLDDDLVGGYHDDHHELFT